jgi:hypothetical protein
MPSPTIKILAPELRASAVLDRTLGMFSIKVSAHYKSRVVSTLDFV